MQYSLRLNFFQLSLRFWEPHFSPTNIVQLIYCILWVSGFQRNGGVKDHTTMNLGYVEWSLQGRKDCLVPCQSQRRLSHCGRDCRDPAEILLDFVSSCFQFIGWDSWLLETLHYVLMLLATGLSHSHSVPGLISGINFLAVISWSMCVQRERTVSWLYINKSLFFFVSKKCFVLHFLLSESL